MQIESNKNAPENVNLASNSLTELSLGKAERNQFHDPYLRSFIGLSGRIGILGTSADPIHQGHIAAAHSVARALSLDALVIVPAYQNPLKQHVPGASGIQRLMMVRDALLDCPGLFVSPIEILKGRPCFSVEIVEQIRKELDPAAELFFIMGSDNLKDLHRWKNVGRLFELTCPVVVSRDGESRMQAIQEIKSQRSLNNSQIEILDGSYLALDLPHISSTEIREAISRGAIDQTDLPDRVREFIEQHGLYKGIA